MDAYDNPAGTAVLSLDTSMRQMQRRSITGKECRVLCGGDRGEGEKHLLFHPFLSLSRRRVRTSEGKLDKVAGGRV